MRDLPMLSIAVALCALSARARAQDLAEAYDATPIEVTPEHERAVERGLEWLAAHQNADGSWTAKIGFKLNSDYRATADAGHVGVTALAGTAFLAGGHTPERGKYSAVLDRALDYVLAGVQDDGYVTLNGSRMYSHAFATLFLAEVCGMTHRADVRSKLQKAVDFIVETQNQEGGWRYVPFSPESDMSIVVCQAMALRAARNIGIRVPKATIDRAARYVVDSAITEESQRGYQGLYPDEVGAFNYQKNKGSRSSFPLTAAGVTALHGLGIYSDESIRRGLDYLRRNLTTFNLQYGRREGGHYFFWYGHYYGVQAMYTAGTAFQVNYWEPYFEEVRTEILKMQDQDGSWPNHTGPGVAFGTSMAVLILEIPYRYLPIFQR
ncbi:MAG: prenyltransferase [Planctomycetes bacterium]|nr:prenyltransferase [Planctomycetota bacterium]